MNNIFDSLKTYNLLTIIRYIYLEIRYVFRLLFMGSYSQMGEDLEIWRLFPRNYKGFYIDVGANDPKRFNNTYLFYKKGWRGINIEPNYENYLKLKKFRGEDINLNYGIGEKEGYMNYYKFIHHTLNTFSEEEAHSYVSQGFKLLEIKKIKVVRLEAVLEKHLLSNQHVDFITIDTEGYDTQVLKSMNLRKYKPKYIMVEVLKHNLLVDKSSDSEVSDFLKKNNYEIVYSSEINSIFKFRDVSVKRNNIS